METMEEPRSNLEEKDSPNMFKDGLSLRADPSIFTSIAPSVQKMPRQLANAKAFVEAYLCFSGVFFKKRKYEILKQRNVLLNKKAIFVFHTILNLIS